MLLLGTQLIRNNLEMSARMNACVWNHFSLLCFPTGTGNAVTSMGTAFVSSAPNTGSRSDSMAMRWAQDKEGSEMQSAGKQDNGAEEHHRQLRAAGSVAVRAL